ncbi:MAG: hypothetical protein IJL91_08210 [Bacteroidales bacterium]|nr:hypothetical protein [Bacteroidales bacterium]
MSVAATIYELSSKPLDVEERTKDYELAHFFHYQNPWWVTEGCPEPIDDADRVDEIDALRVSLPSGYSLVGEKITLNNPAGYWDDTVKRLEGLLQEAKQKQIDGDFYALGWWKDHVDGQHGILIYMSDTGELMTLNEFLLFMIPYSWGTEWKEFYIGSIFYCFN